MVRSVAISRQVMGALLVAGTTIGAGMLALPVATGSSGFMPAATLTIFSWLFMLFSALLLLEVATHMPEGSNLISMATRTLKKKGQLLAWALYLLLFYSLTIAYIVGGGGFFVQITNGFLSAPIATLLFVALFAPIIYAGAHAVSLVNALLMGGLFLSYFLFLVFGWSEVSPALLKQANWLASFSAFPIIFISLSFQGLVPSLYSYLSGNAAVTRRTIILGSLMPLLLNLVWLALVLGIVPEGGPHGLAAAKAAGFNATVPLTYFLSSPFVMVCGLGFAFFALTTSFLGVSLGLFDFFADGFNIPKTSNKKWLIGFVLFVPTTLIAISRPDIFLLALNYAGGLGSSLLLGALPIIMAFLLRYTRLRDSFDKGQRMLFGGRVLLAGMMIFLLFEIICAIKELV